MSKLDASRNERGAPRVGAVKARAPLRSLPGELDHPLADVDPDDLGPLVQQPRRVHARAATGIEHPPAGNVGQER